MAESFDTPEEIKKALEEETLSFRDELLAERGETLTVEDTQRALRAFERLVKGESMLGKVTATQYRLARRFMRRVKKGK